MAKNKSTSKRTFYKSQIVINVVAEGPIEFESLRELAQQITEGDWVGEYDIQDHSPISGKEAASLAIKMNSDPEFFNLDEDGNDK